MASCDGRPLNTYDLITLYDPIADYQHIIKDSEPINEKTKRIKIRDILGGWNSGDMNIVNNALGNKIFLIATNSSAVPKTLIDANPDTETANFLAITENFVTINASSDAVNVRGVGIVYVDTSAGDVTIGGMAGGIANQPVEIIKIGSANNLILEHQEATGTQKMILNAGIDVTLPTYGGMKLRYSGANWYEVGY